MHDLSHETELVPGGVVQPSWTPVKNSRRTFAVSSWVIKVGGQG